MIYILLIITNAYTGPTSADKIRIDYIGQFKTEQACINQARDRNYICIPVEFNK